MKIIPAYIGIIIPSIALIYFAVFDKNKKGIIMSSFAVIVGGFLFQLTIDNIDKIKNFAEEYEKLLNFPIISSIIGIFIGNRLLRYFTHKKNKKEMSVLFVNAIDSQIRDLSYINFYFLSSFMSENLNYIKIYNKNLYNNDFYKTAFNKIGIYEEIEIDIISKYSTSLQEFSNYIQEFLQKFPKYRQELLQEYPFGDYNSNQKTTKISEEIRNLRIFVIVQISISITRILGLLATYTLSRYFAKKYFENPKKSFIEDYEKIIEELQEKFKFSNFYILNRIIAEDLINRLIYVRNRYLELEGFIDYQKQRKPIFICRLSVYEDITVYKDIDFTKQEYDAERNYTTSLITLFSSKYDIVTFGESKKDASDKAKNIVASIIDNAGFENDLYFFAVAKLLNDKYLRFFSFYFHKLIQ